MSEKKSKPIDANVYEDTRWNLPFNAFTDDKIFIVKNEDGNTLRITTDKKEAFDLAKEYKETGKIEKK